MRKEAVLEMKGENNPCCVGWALPRKDSSEFNSMMFTAEGWIFNANQ